MHLLDYVFQVICFTHYRNIILCLNRSYINISIVLDSKGTDKLPYRVIHSATVSVELQGAYYPC